MQFSVAVDGGSLVGWEVGDGTPALILHGGPTSDNTEALPDLLPSTLRTIRYQQRGIEPSTPAEPYDIETHVADAVRVLDDRGVDRAWLIGHSWGGHLAFHVAIAHPSRVLGVIGIDPLGAVPDGGWGELDSEIFERLQRDSPDAAARAKELDERAMYAGVVASVHEHFERGTLAAGLPSFEGLLGIVHGESDPLPVAASRATADLVPHATLDVIEDAGHLPWLEQPEAFRAAVERILSSA